MDVKRYRWPELTMGETLTGNEDSYNHRREYVLATDFDALLAQRDALQGKLTIARSALLDIAAYFKSGNAVPVDRAVIRADSSAVAAMNEALAQIEVK